MQYCHITNVTILFLCTCLISMIGGSWPPFFVWCGVTPCHITHSIRQKNLIRTQRIWISHRHMNTGSMMKTDCSNFLIMTQWSTSLPDDDTPSTTVCTAPTIQVSHSAGTEFAHRLGICHTFPEVYTIYSITSCAFRVGFVVLTPCTGVLLVKMAVGWYKV